ncbi:MAG: diaminopimelate epimerase, partial [Candidatus Solibacter usitatus]|nr:diaminopimelate epimerase [Candidatus Solibacter usitatus]
MKAHGARNDFLLTWTQEAPRENHARIARAICDRHAGVGADGWLLVTAESSGQADGAIRLYNSDGSDSEISGNGTRCAAAFLMDSGLAGPEVRIRTGAGIKLLHCLQQSGTKFEFEMNMGGAVYSHSGFETLELADGPRPVTILDVGNPQCALIIEDFEFDWRRVGAEIERHPRFPKRTNVSFIRRVNEHTLDVRFYERGAGETESSGTGSTGAAATALRLGLVLSPVTVVT